MVGARARIAAALAIPLSLGFLGLLHIAWGQRRDEASALASSAEFHFIRLEYVDRAWASRGFRRGPGRGWWMQDWPAAEIHFAQGVRRLTRIDTGEGRHVPLTDDRIFDYPWAYATQVGYWDLSDAEVKRLREYLLRGGFLVVDDFWGLEEWGVFRQTIERVFPGRPIVEIAEADAVMHVLFDLQERVQIPGLRHLWRGTGGITVVPLDGTPPHWRAIYDEKGRMLVAINFDMDVGDAWEHADLPEYPMEMTGLAYRFGINYIIYSMTH
jgi:hypothetical protein